MFAIVGIVWCMVYENDVTAEEDLHGGEQTQSFVNVPVPTWSRTDDTVLSITSSYVGQLVSSRR